MKILIINSQGHWLNGWMTFESSQQVVVEVLQQSGFEVATVEVSSIAQLQKVLSGVSSDTLVWANAYWVNGENGRVYGLIEAIEKYELPLIGSGMKTLLQLLEKDTCQAMLMTAGVPIPPNITLSQNDVCNLNLDQTIVESDLQFPLVLKPTKESRSMGVTLTHTLEEAVNTAKQLFQKFPHDNLIIEEFLPTDDITCGFLRMGAREMILPSYNVVKGMDCSTEVFSEYHYTLPSENEKQVCIHDKAVLSQLETYLPMVVDVFDIQTTTRIDGRLDRNGVMNFFDINGFPGLNYPVSALVKQCFAHFPNYERKHLFECLIRTIIGDSLLRFNMPVTSIVQEQNLFSLESPTIITIQNEIYYNI